MTTHYEKNTGIIHNYTIKPGNHILINKGHIKKLKRFNQPHIKINGISWSQLENISFLFDILDIIEIKYLITIKDTNLTPFQFIYMLYTNPEIFKNLTTEDQVTLYISIDTFLIRFLTYHNFENRMSITTSQNILIDSNKNNINIDELTRETKNEILYKRNILDIAHTIRGIFKNLKTEAYNTLLNIYVPVVEKFTNKQILRVIINDIFSTPKPEEKDRYEDYDYIADIAKLLYGLVNIKHSSQLLDDTDNKEIDEYFTLEQKTQLISYFTDLITWYCILGLRTLDKNTQPKQLPHRLIHVMQKNPKYGIKRFFEIIHSNSSYKTHSITLPRNYFHVKPTSKISNTQYKKIIEALNILMTNAFTFLLNELT
jgi:hypothetical protein